MKKWGDFLAGAISHGGEGSIKADDRCQADIHYMLSPTKRLPQLMSLIEQRNYSVIPSWLSETGELHLDRLYGCVP